jgi:hypothetical protein
MWGCHELGERQPLEKRNVCRFEIGYLELDVLGEEVFPSLKGYSKSDLADGGHHCSRDYSVEGSLVTSTPLTRDG